MAIKLTGFPGGCISSSEADELAAAAGRNASALSIILALRVSTVDMLVLTRAGLYRPWDVMNAIREMRDWLDKQSEAYSRASYKARAMGIYLCPDRAARMAALLDVAMRRLIVGDLAYRQHANNEEVKEAARLLNVREKQRLEDLGGKAVQDARFELAHSSPAWHTFRGTSKKMAEAIKAEMRSPGR